MTEDRQRIDPPQRPPVLDYALADRRLWHGCGTAGSLLSILAGLAVAVALGSGGWEYLGGGWAYHPWRWYENDAIALSCWAGAVLGLAGGLLLWAARRHGRAYPPGWVKLALAMDIAGVAACLLWATAAAVM